MRRASERMCGQIFMPPYGGGSDDGGFFPLCSPAGFILPSDKCGLLWMRLRASRINAMPSWPRCRSNDRPVAAAAARSDRSPNCSPTISSRLILYSPRISANESSPYRQKNRHNDARWRSFERICHVAVRNKERRKILHKTSQIIVN